MTPKEKENIYERIYEVVRLIPYGSVTNYGAIAAALGMPSGARLVGYAMNNCEKANLDVPAHRVVNRNGLLTGRHHFSPPERMQQLLEAEGILIKEHEVQDFEKKFWNPMTEIV